MAFPFTVNFNRRLKGTIIPDNQQMLLRYIKDYILADKADNVIAEDLHVTYKGSTSYWNGSLYRGIDDGIFNLFYKNDNWWLSYRINMRKLFIATSIMSTVIGVFAVLSGDPWWIGLAAFSWLCGGNWIINVVRHEVVATNIAAGIDVLICGKIELPEEDKMTGKLKSWF